MRYVFADEDIINYEVVYIIEDLCKRSNRSSSSEGFVQGYIKQSKIP